jgi:hypothetical protein
MMRPEGTRSPPRPYLNQSILCSFYREIQEAFRRAGRAASVHDVPQILDRVNGRLAQMVGSGDQTLLTGLKDPGKVAYLCRDKLRNQFVGLLRPNQKAGWTILEEETQRVLAAAGTAAGTAAGLVAALRS